MITATESFKNLSPEKFGVLLARDTLNVPNEEVVFESLVSWISADSLGRSNNLEYLLPHIRASFLSAQFIAERVGMFIVKNRNHDLCHFLDYENKTPRQGYAMCIVAQERGDHKRGKRGSLKYLDKETWTHLTYIP